MRKRFDDRFDREWAPVPVEELVGRVVEHYRLAAAMRLERMGAEWPRFVGERLAKQTRPDKIVDRTLIIEVASSAWLHELRLLKLMVLADLHRELGAPRLFDDIKFVLARDAARPAPRVPQPRKRKPAPEPARPAAGAAREAILGDVASVEDPELRELIARVRIQNDK